MAALVDLALQVAHNYFASRTHGSASMPSGAGASSSPSASRVAALAQPSLSPSPSPENLNRLPCALLTNTVSFLDATDRASFFQAYSPQFDHLKKDRIFGPALAKMDERDRSLQTKFTSLYDLEREQARYNSHTVLGRLRSLFNGLNEAQSNQMKSAFERMKVLIIEDLLYEGYSVEKILQKIEENVARFVPKQMQSQVLADLREAAFQIILKRYASELEHNLGTQTINTDAVAVCTALAAIPHAEKDANLKALKALIADKHPGDIDKARERLIRVCDHPGNFRNFVNEKGKTILVQIARLKKPFQQSPTELIKKLNSKLRCDIGAGFSRTAGQVLTEIAGLHLPTDCSLTEVFQIVDAKCKELVFEIETFERQNRDAIRIIKLLHLTPEEFTADYLRNNHPGFIEYVEACQQYYHLTQTCGFIRLKREMNEKQAEIAALEAAFLDAPRCCVADIETRRKSLDLLAPEGDGFSWPVQVAHFVPPAREESKEDAERVEEVD